MQESSPQESSYVVVYRAVSDAVFIAPDLVLTLVGIDSNGMKIDLTIWTEYVQYGTGDPIPGDLLFEARGVADSLDFAITAAGNTVIFFADAIALATNAVVHEVDLFLAYDNTSQRQQRRFAQVYFPLNPAITRNLRRIDRETLTGLLVAVKAQKGNVRARRTISQYNRALMHWERGSETLAIEFLWVAVETLTPLLKKQLKRKHVLTSDRDLAMWLGVTAETYDAFCYEGKRKNELDAALRKRIIFQNDEECYSKARKVSDGFEHGYEAFETIHESAVTIRDKTASYVREAIFEAFEVDYASQQLLLGKRYAVPAPWPRQILFQGTLVGNTDILNAEGNKHPMLHWEIRVTNTTQIADDYFQVEGHDHIEALLGEGVILYPDSAPEASESQSPSIHSNPTTPTE